MEKAGNIELERRRERMGVLPPGWLRRAAILVSVGIAVTLGIWYFATGSTYAPRGVLRIGFEHVPPVQIRTDTGPTGMAVETVREAAKRAGLRLQWIETGTSSEEALQRGLVDLWPLMIDLPERRKRLHLTQPWLYTSHVILLRSDRTSLDKEFSGRIAVFKIPIHLRLLREAFPKAVTVAVPESRQVIKEVCQGTVLAGFLEGRAALSDLSEKPPECGMVTLRVQNLPGLVTPLGIGSTFEAAGAADRLRSEIGGMFRDGTLAATLAKYSYGLEDTWATYHLMGAADQARWIAWGVGLMSIVVALIVWQAASLRQRRRSEAELRESEERFRNMADTAPVMIWVTGPDKLVTFFNKTYLEFTGRTPEQELGRGWVGLIHPEDIECCSETFHSSFDARRNFHIECRVRRADGEYRTILCRGIPRFAPGGNFAGYIGSDIDITDLRRAQKEALARQKLESLGVLAGGIAHDFNNLLGGILINSELASAGLPVGSSAYGGLETIKTIAVRATDIVRQMMAYAGQENAAFETVNVSGLVSDMLQLLKVSISKTAILKVNLPENVPAVRGNAAQIRQVVMNLITNASEALGEKEGTIFVSVTQVQVGPDSHALNMSHGDYVRLEVSDTGCGMAEEVQARVFDPFFTTKFAGRGLGLAAVQGVIRNHGGIINVISAPGQGSRFEVLLPCAGQAEADASEITVPAPAGEVGNLAGTVLFIEDEDALCLAVSKMLRRKGLKVIEAADGKTGIDFFRASATQIDVVLLDLTLPGMSGGEVLRELRRIQPDMKVIIMSAYSRDRVLEAIGEQQPWLYIRKPYQFSELIALVRNVRFGKMSSEAYG